MSEVQGDGSIEASSSQPIVRKINVEDMERPEFNELVQNLTDHTITRENVKFAKLRDAVRGGIFGVRNKIAKVCRKAGDHGFWDKLQNLVYTAYAGSEYMEKTKQGMRGMIENQQIFGAETDGELVAIMGYRKFGDNTDGREIYELTKASRLPKYKGKGIATNLSQQIFMEINSRFPGSLIITCTSNTYLQDLLRQTGVFREIEMDADDYFADITRKRMNDPEEARRMKGKGYKIYVWDPQASTSGV